MMRHTFWFAVAALLSMTLAPCARALSTWDGGDGTDSWGDNGNWFPDFPPVGDVSIGLLPTTADALTRLNANYSLNSLAIYRGADVINSTNGGATASLLHVDGIVELSSDFGGGSSITLFGNGLDAGRFLIEDGGTLNLNSQAAAGMAIARFDNGPTIVDAGGTIVGNGRIDVAIGPDDEPHITLFNDGTLSASAFGIFLDPPPTQLQIIGNNPRDIVSLDGSGGGVVNVNNNATLRVDTLSVGSFSGDLNLFRGGTLRIANPWTIGGGTVDVSTPGVFAGTAGAAAHLAGGAITYSGGTMSLGNLDSLTLDAPLNATGGVINNHGTITVNAPATFQAAADFNMIGSECKLVVNSVLVVRTPDFNLDGDGLIGNVTTINSGGSLELDLGAGADEEFNHAINLNGGAMKVSTADDVWTLGPSGVINALGPATSTVFGETLQVMGSTAISVAAGTRLDVQAATQLIGASNVTIGANAILDFGVVTYNHLFASYSGAGTLYSGNATIAAPTTWNVATVNLDDGGVTLNANLTINANSIDDVGDGFNAAMTINEGAALAVNIAGGGGWAVDAGGTITFNGDLIDFDTYLAGSSIALNGTLNNNGAGISNARLDIGLSGDVNIASSIFVLNGGNTTTSPNTIAGGTIDGPGGLFIMASRELRGFGTINAVLSGTGTLCADNGILNVNAIQTINVLGTEDADGILNVTGPWNTVQTAAVELNDGELRGATIFNDGAGGIGGHGLVSAKVINDTHIDATKTGTLTLQTAANDNDWDGASGGGQLNAITADLELRDNTSFPFTGTVSAEDGHSVFANGFELEFQPGSTIHLTAGTYRSTESTRFGGNMTVHAGGVSTLRIGSIAEFEGTSVTTLGDDLALDVGTAMVHPNAQFNAVAPDASLVVVVGSVLQLRDGASVGVPILNPGLMILGESFVVGQASAASYLQTGALAVDLGGTGPNQHDALDLTGPASLSGRLLLQVVDGYVPVLGQTIDILTADGGVSGKFDQVLHPSLPGGLRFAAFYKPESVFLKVVSSSSLSADFDRDLDVDGADLAVWKLAFGLSNLGDADGDNDSDGADFLAWQRQLGGAAVAARASAAIPEPGGCSLLISGILAILSMGSSKTVFLRITPCRRQPWIHAGETS